MTAPDCGETGEMQHGRPTLFCADSPRYIVDGLLCAAERIVANSDCDSCDDE